MPGTFIEGNVLHNITIAPDQNMGRDPQVRYQLLIGVFFWVDRVGEQCINTWATKLPRWKAYRVYNDQRKIIDCLSFITIGAFKITGL